MQFAGSAGHSSKKRPQRSFSVETLEDRRLLSTTYEPIWVAGKKFNDLNGDGLITPNEPGIANWTISLDLNNDGTIDVTTQTDSEGFFKFDNVPEGTHKVFEGTLPTGWTQTFPDPTVPDPVIPSDPPEVIVGPGYYLITPVTLRNIDGLAFANTFSTVPAKGSIAGQKFLDVNGDGQKDVDGVNNVLGDGDDEVGLSGWTIYLDQNQNSALDPGEVYTTTDASGNYAFNDLDPGTYYVRELLTGAGWVQTTANPAPITLVAGQDVCDVDFGNKPVTPPAEGGGGHTPGYWGNKNGFKTMNDGGTVAPELALLRSLNLKDGKGNDFDPTSYDQFKNWLRGSNATNMAYKLSVHLACMALNIEAGFVNAGALVYATGTMSAGGGSTASIGSIVSEANDALADASSSRSYLETLKDVLDKANNNSNWAS